MGRGRITIVLDRLRSAENVGNIFRIAEAVGAAEIIGCGYTPLPPHRKISRTAMGTENAIPCRRTESAAEAIQLLRSEGCAQILAAEPGPGAVPAWKCTPEYPLALIFGNEALGVAAAALALADGRIELPMAGTKASINVGNAAAAILFALRARERRENS